MAEYSLTPGADYSADWHKNQIAAAEQNSKDAYQRAIAQHYSEDDALNAAKFAWQKTMDEAGLTGYYQGAPTMGTQQWWATTFGNWQTPTAGQETMAREQQTFAQQQALANLYGQTYQNFGTVPGGQRTLTAEEQAFTQALRTQQEQRAAQAQQQSQTQAYLNILAGLRGPADWAKYQQVLGATPGGMRDLYAAAMGQYVPGGGATTGVNPQAASLQSLMGQVSGQGYAGQGGGQLKTPNVYGQNTQGVYNQAQNNLAALTGQGQPGTSTWTGASPNVTPAYEQQYVPMHAAQNQQYQQNLNQQMQAAGNGTNVMGAPQNQMNLPAPNQVAAQSWKNLAPSQQQLMLGEWEAAGWHKPDVEALMNQTLPKYAANAPTAGTWRM